MGRQREVRRPIIGKETLDRTGRWTYDRRAHIVFHLLRGHLGDAGPSRPDWTTEALVEPETGLYWESHRFQYMLQGAGPYSLVPLTHRDYLRRYSCPKRRKPQEPIAIEGAFTATADGSFAPDQTLHVLQHLVESHYLEAEGAVGVAGKLYENPEDGSYWQVEALSRGRVLMTLASVPKAD